jgi:hypothetical protein
MRETRKLVLILTFALFIGCSDSDSDAGAGGAGGSGVDFTAFEWTELNGDAPWAARAGLHTVELGGRFYLMGGRTPLDPATLPFPIPGASTFWSDVWVSDDEGATWTEALETDGSDHWAPRAYFQAVVKDDAMYVLGGQDFGIMSNFFSDVWSSTDGVEWTQLTEDAGWAGRAGLRAVVFRDEIYIFGGSQFDDAAIVPGEAPARIYYNDVWKSADGTTWEEMTADAPWEPRAGSVVVVKDDFMYLLGGERGFLCDPLPDCELPYFNDVWRSQDGAAWELVTESAGWSPRPGHQCAVSFGYIVCWGGFGLPENPMDVWVSQDGATWQQVSDAPWNAETTDDIKYDFEGIAVGDVIYTFGGDRETFDFEDPTNYLRVDNDVWRYAMPAP